MKLNFYKYQGTGNDFVMIDNRQSVFDKNNTKLIQSICNRRFGIGADGLILLENHLDHDFKMVYYNADGSQSFCGNGARCAMAFAKQLSIIKDEASFEAIDGIHNAIIENGIVKLHMHDVEIIQKFDSHVFLDTGSPHHIVFKEDIGDFDIKAEGAKIRYGEPYNKIGTNVNFVKKLSDSTFRIRTYERGVENETLSCGTGVTAVALAMHNLNETNHKEIALSTEGGELKVSFEEDNGAYKNIWLIGPAELVFRGSYDYA